MAPLRVMHVVLQLTTGGLEKFLVDLIPRFDREKVQSTVCCIEERGNFADTLDKIGIKTYLVRKKELGEIKFYSELKKLYIKEGVNIVHSYSGVYRDAIISAKLAKIPINLHTDQGAFYPDTKKTRFNHWFFSHFRDRVIAVSDELRNFLIQDIRLNPAKTITIYNGVAVEDHALRINVAEKKRQLNIQPDEKVIGIIARLAPVKDHKTLFTAFKKVRQAYPNMKLLVVGEGPLTDDLKRFAGELEEERNIIFLGKRNDVKELLHIMDIVCLSSVHEGLSLTLLEAMASGKPVVATNVGGNPELVADGVTGILVPPQDSDKMAEALIELLGNETKRKSMGEEARKRVNEKFHIKNTAREYENLYFTLARNKGII